MKIHFRRVFWCHTLLVQTFRWRFCQYLTTKLSRFYYKVMVSLHKMHDPCAWLKTYSCSIWKIRFRLQIFSLLHKTNLRRLYLMDLFKKKYFEEKIMNLLKINSCFFCFQLFFTIRSMFQITDKIRFSTNDSFKNVLYSKFFLTLSCNCTADNVKHCQNLMFV